MTKGFGAYRLFGHRGVDGYTESPAISLLKTVDNAQRDAGVGGPIAEIGVHHGQLFIAMKLLQRPGEASIAIDLFEDQDANIDNSGEGDLDWFLRHIDRWTGRDGLVIHEGDSTKIKSGDIPELKDVRLFSIDGGHTEEIVHSDMRLAENTLADGGVAIADDVFNQQWPGVAVGTLHYLEHGGGLVPFYIGFNKVLFARARPRPAVSASHRQRLRRPNHDGRIQLGVCRPRRRDPGASAETTRGCSAPQRDGARGLPPPCRPGEVTAAARQGLLQQRS